METILHGLLLWREDQEMRIMNPVVGLIPKAFPLNECLDFLYGQLRERAWARWIKSCAVIGHLSGIHGAILRARDYPLCPARKIFPKSQPYNKSFIDQSCSVKMVGYWSRSFFCEFMDLDSVSVREHTKNAGTRPISSHLDLALRQ